MPEPTVPLDDFALLDAEVVDLETLTPESLQPPMNGTTAASAVAPWLLENPEGRLSFILGCEPEYWYKEFALPVLAHFRNDPRQWGIIISRWGSLYQKADLLVAAVDDWKRKYDPTLPGVPNSVPNVRRTSQKKFPRMLVHSGPVNLREIHRALQMIPVSISAWETLGLALAAVDRPETKTYWNAWSSALPTYDQAAQERLWDTFKENKLGAESEEQRVGLGVLFALAAQHGYAAPAPDAWRSQLLVDKQGDPKENASNLTAIFANHPAWLERGWWDTVRQIPMLRHGDTYRPITDEDLSDIAAWLGFEERMGIRSLQLLEKQLYAYCHKTPRDPIQEYLNTLPAWDGVPRLDTWLQELAGVEDMPLNRAIAQLLIVSMVARAYVPGCLYRYVVILEGAEETKKSTLVHALGHPWAMNLSMGLESKEAHLSIQGVWVAELTELDSLSRSEESRIKAFVTMTHDEYIPKYSNVKEQRPRRTIFIGTTNETEYLKGLAGNTRFLPIKITQAIDMDGFAAMKPQLFAEAIAWYRAHEGDWWALPDDAAKAADRIRAERRIVSEHETPLAAWLEGRERVTWKEIAVGYMEASSPERWTRALQMEIGKALKAIGWAARVSRNPLSKATERIWVPPDVADREEQKRLGVTTF